MLHLHTPTTAWPSKQAPTGARRAQCAHHSSLPTQGCTWTRAQHGYTQQLSLTCKPALAPFTLCLAAVPHTLHHPPELFGFYVTRYGVPTAFLGMEYDIAETKNRNRVAAGREVCTQRLLRVAAATCRALTNPAHSPLALLCITEPP